MYNNYIYDVSFKSKFCHSLLDSYESKCISKYLAECCLLNSYDNYYRMKNNEELYGYT